MSSSYILIPLTTGSVTSGLLPFGLILLKDGMAAVCRTGNIQLNATPGTIKAVT
jgi:hypothetical protein